MPLNSVDEKNSPSQGPIFYLSYAASDHDEHLDKFYDELCASLAARMDQVLQKGEIGFRDPERSRPGEVWQESLGRVLLTSRVLVGIYTPAYFASKICGKEFQIFQERAKLLNQKDIKPDYLNKIVPVLWVGEKKLKHRQDLPDKVRNISHGLRDDPQYLAQGLLALSRNTASTSIYQRVVGKLAERIHDLATQSPLPPSSTPLSFDDVSSAFHPTDIPEVDRPPQDTEVKQPKKPPASKRIQKTKKKEKASDPAEKTARTPASAVDIPKLIFRLVVARELDPEILIRLDADKIIEALRKYDGRGPSDPMRLEEVQRKLEEEQSGIEPNLLWLNWMRVADTEQTRRLEDMLSNEKTA